MTVTPRHGVLVGALLLTLALLVPALRHNARHRFLEEQIVQCIRLRHDLALSDFARSRTTEEITQLEACGRYELELRAMDRAP